jgi:hypothetical protein
MLLYLCIFSDDIFVIEEVSLYDGECKENTYAVAGDILDGVSFSLAVPSAHISDQGLSDIYALSSL